ncbi:MAG TPA: hypothetical protein VMU74_10500 [Gaiellaceae bacterium]|nr:hypothetical protein [Gaiellaceae bacterium]
MGDFLRRAKRRRVATLLGIALFGGLLCGVALAGNPHRTTTTTTTSSGNVSGVKPSSTTAHKTHASAGSNKTKQYGNGKTAGQIAEKNGASSSTDLYGPGNSQPHKVAVCRKNGKTHSVDVHALKGRRVGACPTGGSSTGGSSSNSSNSSSNSSNSSSSGSVNAAGTNANGNVGTHAGAGKPSNNSGVLGASNSGVLGASQSSGAKPVAARAKAAHAVLGAASFTG